MELAEKQSYNALAILKMGDFHHLKNTYAKWGDWSAAWRAEGRGSNIDPGKAWSEMRDEGIELILQDEEAFPAPLREIHQCPWGLYYKGDLSAAGSPAIAIVGTRKATSSGLTVAKNFARDLAAKGINIVSGLALGIDASAHSGALEGGGRTAAILARGLDGVYPAQNENLARKILANDGALISEYPVKSPTLPFRFIERNRITSGLSNATIIIEAPSESGALATARFALEQNRDVGAIPGPINHPNYTGNHSLIKSGAALIASVDDIIAMLNLDQLPLKIKKSPILTEDELAIMNALKSEAGALSVDKIIELGRLEPQTTQRALSLLLMKDIIRESDGRYELN